MAARAAPGAPEASQGQGVFVVRTARRRIPFGLEPADFVEFATTQFSRRSDRIELARSQSLEEIYRAPDEEGM